MYTYYNCMAPGLELASSFYETVYVFHVAYYGDTTTM